MIFFSADFCVTYKVVAPHTNLRVFTRVYDVKGGGGAIFSKNRFFGTTHGDAWTPRLRSPSLIMAPVFIHLNCFRLGTEGRYSIASLKMFFSDF